MAQFETSVGVESPRGHSTPFIVNDPRGPSTATEDFGRLVGNILPLARNAMEGKMAADLFGSTSNVNEIFPEPGGVPRGSELPDMSNLTNISSAYSNGLIGRGEAQLRTRVLLKQLGVENPGYASFFRRQAAQFFSGSLGGGGANPFGGLTPEEKRQAGLQSKVDNMLFEAGYDVRKLDAQSRERITAVVMRQRYQSDQLELRTKARKEEISRLNLDKAASDAEFLKIDRDVYFTAVDWNNKNTEDTFKQIEQFISQGNYDEAFQTANLHRQALLDFMSKGASADIRGRIEPMVARWTEIVQDLDPAKREERRLGFIERRTRMMENIQKQQLLQAFPLGVNTITQLGESAGRILESLGNSPDSPEFKKAIEVSAKILEHTNTLLEQSDKLMKGQEVDTDFARKATGAAWRAETSNLDYLIRLGRAFRETGEMPTNELGLTPETLPLILKDAINKAGMGGDSYLPTAPSADKVNAWTENLEVMNEWMDDPDTYAAIVAEGVDGISRRMDVELIEPLFDASRSLVDSLPTVENRSTGIATPLKAYVDMSFDADTGVTLAIDPDASSQLTQEDLGTLSNAVNQFNTRIAPRISNALTTRKRLLDVRAGGKSQMNESDWKEWSFRIGDRLGLNESRDEIEQNTVFEPVTDMVNDKLKRLEALDSLGELGSLSELTPLVKDADRKQKVVVAQRNAQGVMTSTTKQVSQNNLAKEAAKQKREDSSVEEPFDTITNPISAIKYAKASHPELFEGISENYLVKVARQESSMNPNAKAPGSSATGLWQFINSTWEGQVRNHGHKYNIRGDMRTNPVASTLMMGEFTQENRRILKRALGREPTEAELYTAHFMGAGGASTFLTKPDDARIVDVVPSSWIDANPWLSRHTVKSLRDKFGRVVA